MKHYSKWLFTAMAAGLLFSCSSENETPTPPSDPGTNGPGYYMGVNIITNAAQGTRSFTDGDNSSNDKTEVGYDKENYVGSMLVVLAKNSDNSFIAASQLNNDRIQGTSNPAQFLSTSKFSREAIDAYYEAGNVETTVNIFIFANPNEPLKAALASATLGDKEWVNTVAKLSSVNDGSLWSTAGKGSFVMSNYEIATREIPAKAETWAYYTTADNAFNLSGDNTQGEKIDNSTAAERGNIKIHRMAARFDFKDGAPDAANAPQTYPVMKQVAADGTVGETLVNIKLTDMSLVNLNNSEYYLERVSADGQDANSTLCGAEKPWFSDANGTPIAGSGNYVVDVYAQLKTKTLTTGFDTYMYYPLFNNEGEVQNASAWATSKISDVLGGMSDNYGEKKYKIWRYATENVIPAENEQSNGWSTGVVFRGMMKATDAALNSENTYVKNMATALNGAKEGENPWLFKFGNNLFAGWDDMKRAAINAAYDHSTKQWNRNDALYVDVFGTGGVGTFILKLSDGTEDTVTDELPADDTSANALYDAMKAAEGDAMATATAAFKAKVTGEGIAIYEAENGSEGWGYYCNYYYWNRHNDNNLPGIMGPMEFAVVRNNVYKLSVTQIRLLGHPVDPKNDPDVPTPEDPDEPTDIYMTVNVEVVPWVVRINDIIL